MKLILHMAGAELRRMRGWVLLWMGVLVLPIAALPLALGDMNAASDAQETATWYKSAILVELLVGYLLVLVLMQGDPVIGTRQFWLTRPIGRGRMLLAKTLTALAVVGGGAVAVGVPWWFYCGATVGDVLWMSGEYLALAIVVIAPAMVLSVLTDTLGRAILWSVVWFALVIAAVAPLSFLGTARQFGPLVVWSLLTTGGLWLGLAAVAVVGVFYTRRRGWTIALGAVTLATPWGVGLLLPERGFLNSEPAPLKPEMGAAIGVTFHDAFVVPGREPRAAAGGRGVEMRFDHLRVSFAGDRPEGEFQLVGIGARELWRWDGLAYPAQNPMNTLERPAMPGYSWPAPDPESDAKMAAARAQAAARFPGRKDGRGGFPARPEKGVYLQTYALVPASLAARMGNEPSRYEGRLWLSLLRTDVRHRAPVRAGETSAGGGGRTQLNRVEVRAEGTVLALTQFVPSFWTRSVKQEMDARRWFQMRLEPSYLLINEARKEVRALSGSRQRVLHVHGVAIAGMTLTSFDGRVWRNEAWVERPGWLEAATLAWVGAKVESVFVREVSVPEFKARRSGYPE